MFLNRAITTALVAAVLTAKAAAVPAHVNETTEYEYVVVGSGAGGGSLAATLARRGHSVFLIEAGGDHGDSILQQVPGLSGQAAENTEMAWHFFVRHYRNETQARRDSKFTYLLEDGSWYTGLDPPEGAQPLGTYYPRGATVGGSTQVNAQGFVLAADNDWEYLAEFTGDESWNAASMHDYFVELENCTYVPENTPGHGFDGFISSRRNNISYAVDNPDSAPVLARLEQELSGIEVRDREHQVELMRRDTNSAEHHYIPGVYQDVVSITGRGRRSGTRTYIRDTIDQGYPLTLSTHSLATKVLFKESEGCDPVAYGVEYMVGESLYAADQRYNPDQTGELHTVKAKKEVILAAGAFNTPQLLKLSGVGPRDELEHWQIPVVKDLPAVGSNLQDHTEGVLIANASAEWTPGPYTLCNFHLDDTDPCFVQWEQEGGGPYAEGASSQAVGIQTSESTTGEVDIWVVGGTGVMARGFEPGYSMPAAAPNSWSWIMVKVRPPGDAWSTGNVTLRSADPRAVPTIEFDWLQGEAGERDLRALTEGAETLMRGFEAAPDELQPFVRHQPAEDELPAQSFRDEAFGHHASSTCRMGPAGDQMACVDSKLRVNGVKNLRIADASVFPYTPGSFPALSVHLIGLKAADMLLE